jgi:adenine deaminase
VAHDCHQLLVVGTDDDCMAQAANQLMRDGGGQLVVKDRKVIGRVELEIAGLMSTEKVEVVARKARRVLDGFAAIGCRMNSPNIQLSFLALTAIPQLRISDMGLVDVSGRKLVPVLERG